MNHCELKFHNASWNFLYFLILDLVADAQAVCYPTRREPRCVDALTWTVPVITLVL